MADPLLVPDPQVVQELAPEDEKAPEIKAIRHIDEELANFSSIDTLFTPTKHDLTELKVIKELDLIIFRESTNLINFKLYNQASHFQTIVKRDPAIKINSFLVTRNPDLFIVGQNSILRTYELQIKPEEEESILLKPKQKIRYENDINSLGYYPQSRLLFSSHDDIPIKAHRLSNEGLLTKLFELNTRLERCFDKLQIYDNLLISTEKSGFVVFWKIGEEPDAQPVEIKHHKGIIRFVEISVASNKMLTSSIDHGIKLWNLKPPSLESQLIGHDSEVTALSIAHDGSKAVSGDLSFYIIIWDLFQHTELNKILMHSGKINQIIITENDKYFLTCSADKKIKVGELTTNSYAIELRGHKDSVSDVKVLGSTIYTISKDKSLGVWNLPVQIESTKINISGRHEYCKVFSKQDIFIAVSDNTIEIFRCRDQNYNLLSQNTDLLISKTIKSFKFSSDFTTIYCTFNESKQIQRALIDNQNLNEAQFSIAIEDLEEETGPNLIFEVLPDNCIFTVDKTGNAVIWNVADAENQLTSRENINYNNVLDIECYDYNVFDGIPYFTLAKRNCSIDLIKIDPGLRIVENVTNADLVNVNSRVISSILLLNPQYVAYVIVDDFRIYVSEILNTDIVTNNLNPNANTIQGMISNPTQNLKPEPVQLKTLTISGHRKAVTIIIKKTIGDSEFIISVSDDLTLRAWVITWTDPPIAGQIATQREILEIFEIFALQEHTKSIVSLVDLPNTNYVATASKDTNVIVWNILERRIEKKYTSHTSPIIGLNILIDSTGNSQILSYSSNSIHIWDYSHQEINGVPVSINGAHDSIDKLIALYKLKYRGELNENQRFITFGQERFTYLHFYAYWNVYLPLGPSLMNNFPITSIVPIGGQSFSPLFYAAKYNSMECLKLFIERLNILSQTDLNTLKAYCYSIRNDINNLLQTSSSSLSMFFECIFIRNGLPKISSKYNQIPQLCFKKSNVLNEQDFYSQGLVEKEEILLEFRTCCIELPIEFGSDESIKFLKSLDECKIFQVFRTKLISNIIDYKWNTLKKWIFLHAVVFWFLLVLIGLLIAGYESLAITVLFVTTNFLLLIYELLQIITSGGEYFLDKWNTLDIAILIFNIIWVTFLSIWQEGLAYFDTFPAWLVVGLSFFRGISCFRVFDNTRFYIQLILVSIKDCMSFIFIYFYTTLAFGIMIKSSGILNDEGAPYSNFDYFWRLSYDENIGGLDSNSTNYLFYATFMIASIINVTIMLNLLISILGDSFDRFQVESFEADQKLKLEGILEIEQIMNFSIKSAEKKFIHMCLQVEYNESETEWEGKIMALNKKIDNLTDKVYQESERNHKAILKMGMKNQDSIRGIYKKIDNLQSSLMHFISEERTK